MIPSLQTENTQLLIIDIQGKLADIVVDSETVLKNTETLIKSARILNLPIVWVEQNPEGLGRTHENLKTLLEEQKEMLPKHTFSAFKNENIRKQIAVNARKQILVCGVEAHVCVYQTAMDLLNENYEVHLITDAVSSRTEKSRELGIAKMCKFGAVESSTEMALFELMKTHQHSNFREILKLIK